MEKTEYPKNSCKNPTNDFKTAQKIAYEVKHHYRLKAYKNEEDRNKRDKNE